MNAYVNSFSIRQTSAREVEAARQSANEAALAAKAAADAAAAAARQSGGNLSRDELRQQLQETIRAARDAAREAARSGGGSGVAFDQDPPIPPTPPSPPFSQSDIQDFNTHVAPEIITAIRETAPRVVSMLSITLVLCVVGFPLARAFARWIDRRGAKAPPITPDMDNRLRGIEQAVESIALEVERISEGQRFTTKLLNDRTHQPAPDFRGSAREHEMAGTASAPLSSSKL